MSNNQFYYKYTAPTEEERKEIDSIRRQYQPREKAEESKLDKLRRLDALVKNSAITVSLVLGVVGCLVFGLGLTMILEWERIVAGIIVAVVGSFPMGLAYPVYALILDRNKKKYGAEILSLSEELLNEKHD